MEKYPIFLIIFNSLCLALLIPTLIVVKWKNIHIVNLIFFLIMTSHNLLGLIFAIFIYFKKCCLKIGMTSCCCTAFSTIVGLLINITEIICILIFIDNVNYPCKSSKETCTQSNPCSDSSSYYYYVYYYYRRLTPEYDCKELPEDFYTGIVTKAESKLAYTTLFLTLFFNFFILAFWSQMLKEHYHEFYYETCDCSCSCCDCSYSCCDCSCCDCSFCCFKKFKEKKKVDIKVDIQNTDTNNIKAVPDIDIHPTEPKSKEPIQEKTA